MDVFLLSYKSRCVCERNKGVRKELSWLNSIQTTQLTTTTMQNSFALSNMSNRAIAAPSSSTTHFFLNPTIKRSLIPIGKYKRKLFIYFK